MTLAAALIPLILTLASPAAPRPDSAAPPTDDTVVATYRGGEVSAAEVESWSRFVQLDSGAPSRLDLRRKVEEIVILETLAGRFAALPATMREETKSQSRQLEALLAQRALHLHLMAQAEPTEADLRRLFEVRRAALAEPGRWRLEDIFKAYPPGADESAKGEIRKTLEGVRARLAAGADFAVVAQAESESSTRLRGGAMGFVTLDRLAPRLAEVVAAMRPGELSPVIDLPRGAAIVRCVQVLEPVAPSFERAREDLATELRNERFQALREDVERKGGPSLEADRLGLTKSADHQLLLRWKNLELEAQAVANESTRPAIGEPSEDELRAAFEARPEGWSEPGSRHLRRLRVPIRNDLPASLYDRVHELGRELQGAGGDLGKAASALAPHAQVEDLGWLSDDEVWALGLNANAAVLALEPGGFSPAVQEGRSLLIFELLGKRDERKLSFAEAKAYVRASLLDRRRREAGAKLRQRILEEQAIRLTGSE